MWGLFTSDPLKNFPFAIGDEVSGIDGTSLWTLHNGKRKVNGENVSIFSCFIKDTSETAAEIARACFKRIKTLRHPNIITYIDGLESDKVLHIVTEHVVPLNSYLLESQKDDKLNDAEISWGLHSICTALSFMVNDCSMVHNNICLASIFVNDAGEWLVGGLEFAYKSDTKTTSVIEILPALEKYNPPEKPHSAPRSPPWSVDSWGLGCLIWETFNGSLPTSSSLKVPGKIPKSLLSCYPELVCSNPKSRLNPSKFIDVCRKPNGYMDNEFVNTMLFLEEIQLKDQNEKIAFFQKLTPSLDNFPLRICKYKLLPQLVNAFEFGNAGAVILAPLLKVGKSLDAGEYQKMIVPCVIKLFSSPDRNTRVKLLKLIDTFIDHLSPATVNDQIFSYVAQGFTDSNHVVRECTIKAMVYMASKLSYRNLNEELMKYFARLQAKDDQGGIRTNTTICLGKIAPYMDPKLRQKFIISAFLRALKDPFPPARQAGVLAMVATQNYYHVKEIATRLLPGLCITTVDPEESVRNQAFKAINEFLVKLKTVSEDPTCLSEMEKDVMVGGAQSSSVISGWTGWAVTGMASITSRLYKPRSASNTGNSLRVSETSKGSQEISSQQSKESSQTNQSTDDSWNEPEDIAPNNNENYSENNLDYDGNTWEDSWDVDDDWGSLECLDDKLTTNEMRSSDDYHTASSYFSNSPNTDFFSQIIMEKEDGKRPTQKRNSSRNNLAVDKDNQSQDTTNQVNQSSSMWQDSDWNDATDWSFDENKIDLTQNQRNSSTQKQRNDSAKKQQRQQELEAKREARRGGALKLGVKKIDTNID